MGEGIFVVSILFAAIFPNINNAIWHYNRCSITIWCLTVKFGGYEDVLEK
jgi:hypothetical protein